MEQLFNQVIDGLGLTPTTLLILLGVASVVFNIIGRLIPDDAEGFLGFVRKLSKVLGLYVSNRISGGLSVNDAARVAVHEVAPIVGELQERAILKPFPGAEVHVATRGKDGKFQKVESPWPVAILALLLLLPMLGGCATAGTTQLRAAAQAVCQSVPELAVAINLIRDDTNRERALFALHGLERACPLLFPQALREANRLRANA